MITIEACWGARTTTRLLPGRCSTPRSSSTATAPTGANDTVRSQHRRCKSYCKYRYCRSQMMRGIYVYIYIYIYIYIHQLFHTLYIPQLMFIHYTNYLEYCIHYLNYTYLEDCMHYLYIHTEHAQYGDSTDRR